MLRVVFSLLMAMVALGWAWVDPSWADKVATPLVFKDPPALTAVLSLYETTPENQADVAKVLLKSSRSFYKPIAGFESLALFNSTDGTRIASLTLWQDTASYEAFQASLTTAEEEDYTKYYEKFVKERPGGSASFLEPPDPLLTATLTVDRVVAPPSLMPITVVENALVQITGLGAKTADQQAILSAVAQNSLDALPSLYPAPRTALLFSSTEAPYLALVANWGYGEEFSDFSQVPAIPMTLPPPTPAPDLDIAPGEDLASETSAQIESEATETDPTDWLSQDDHLYQLVKVVAPKVNKYEANKY